MTAPDNRTQNASAVTPGWPHNGLACCCVQRTAYSARVVLPCIVSWDDSAVFRF